MKYISAFLITLSILSFSYYRESSITIKGTITDALTGQPVASAIIQTENGNFSTRSDAAGAFSIQVPDNIKTLLISAAGFQHHKINLKTHKKEIPIALQRSAGEMQEVVVTGIAKSEDLTSILSGRAKGLIANKSVSSTRSNYNNYQKSLNSEFNTEDYDAIVENRFLEASSTPLSTFSIDVDGASYSNVRRFLNMGQLPPAGSVRVEEMINYFRYNYLQPEEQSPFSINTEVGKCPWNGQHQLVMIGLQGRKIRMEKLPASNLVFLIDVSGSMMDENKLPLVKSSLKLLTEQLREQDRVSIVVYAGNAGLVLPPTTGDQKQKISDAIESLEAGGSTAGGAGIKLAYSVAKQNYQRGGNNRVILCTDGDFNIGMSSDAEMERLIETERKSGVFLTVLGYGMGNYKDNKMQKLADKGNGNHSYIDNLQEAKKVLVHEFGGTLFTIAKDVKLQVEFNPALVEGYRLIGYENRMLHKEDFNNDNKDAGEIGSGHTVTALYEIIPAGTTSKWIERTDPLKYQHHAGPLVKYKNDEMMNIKIRYKEPEGDKSKLLQHAVNSKANKNPSVDFMFASAVAQYGMLLNNSEFRQSSSFENAKYLAQRAQGNDHEGYRKEFLSLLDKASELVIK